MWASLKQRLMGWQLGLQRAWLKTHGWFSVGHDLHSNLEVYTEQVGNVKEALALVRDYKKGSLAMKSKQRQYMSSSVMYKYKDLGRGGTFINATWFVEGGVFRKWISAGTAVYDYKASSVTNYMPPLFYTKTETRVQLLLSAALESGFEKAKVIGRVLPRFDAASPDNIDLFSKMKLKRSSLEVTASSDKPMESWDDGRLKDFTVTPALNLTKHQGIGMVQFSIENAEIMWNCP